MSSSAPGADFPRLDSSFGLWPHQNSYSLGPAQHGGDFDTGEGAYPAVRSDGVAGLHREDGVRKEVVDAGRSSDHGGGMNPACGLDETTASLEYPRQRDVGEQTSRTDLDDNLSLDKAQGIAHEYGDVGSFRPFSRAEETAELDQTSDTTLHFDTLSEPDSLFHAATSTSAESFSQSAQSAPKASEIPLPDPADGSEGQKAATANRVKLETIQLITMNRRLVSFVAKFRSYRKKRNELAAEQQLGRAFDKCVQTARSVLRALAGPVADEPNEIRIRPSYRIHWHNRGGYFLDLPLSYFRAHSALLGPGQWDKDRCEACIDRRAVFLQRSAERWKGTISNSVAKCVDEFGVEEWRRKAGCLDVAPIHVIDELLELS